MKPPICPICDTWVNESEKGAIYFKKGPDDLEWDRQATQPGFTGHPPYMEVFCEKHYPVAIKYKDLQIREAMIKILRETGGP